MQVRVSLSNLYAALVDIQARRGDTLLLYAGGEHLLPMVGEPPVWRRARLEAQVESGGMVRVDVHAFANVVMDAPDVLGVLEEVEDHVRLTWATGARRWAYDFAPCPQDVSWPPQEDGRARESVIPPDELEAVLRALSAFVGTAAYAPQFDALYFDGEAAYASDGAAVAAYLTPRLKGFVLPGAVATARLALPWESITVRQTKNYLRLLTRRGRMQGFLVLDYYHRGQAAPLWDHVAIFCASILVLGAAIGFLVRRVHMLSRYSRRRG